MKKFFSLIAAVLFAGSMMATEVTVSKTVEELVTAYSWENGTVVTPFALDEVITVSTEATDANTGKYYIGGNQVRLYQTGAAKLFISAAEGYTISSITLTYVSYNTGILKEAESDVAVDFNNVQSATFTVGNSGTATNGQVRLTAFSVTYNGEGGSVTPDPDPQPTDDWSEIVFTEAITADALAEDATFKSTEEGFEAKIADSGNKMSIDANDCRFGTAENYGMYRFRLKSGGASGSDKNFLNISTPVDGKLRVAVRTASNSATDRALYILQGEDTLYNGIIQESMAVKVMEDATEVSVYPFVEVPVKAGNVVVRYNAGLNFYAFGFKAGEVVPPTPQPSDTLTCAQAADLALAGNTDEAIIKGYVTKIQEAWSSYKNVSFWMADAKDGGEVFEAFRVVCETAEEAPALGDLVWVKGNLAKYQSTPETAKGGSFGIIEKNTDPVVGPENLGEKTIAEFLELKNTVDTCILTGVVANVKNDQFGNFDLIDETDTVYVYGLLTAAGEQKKCFQEEGIAEGDTLKVLAIYGEYQGNPQVKNAIFVSLAKKETELTGDTINVTMSEGLRFYDNVANAGWWELYGSDDEYVIELSNVSTEQIAGVYAYEDLDSEYAYIGVINGEDTTYVNFVDGAITLAVTENSVTAVGALIGEDGKVYNLNLAYVIPTVQETVNVVIAEGALYDAYADYGLYAVYGEDENEVYVQLAIWAENGFEGNFTEEDLDNQVIGSYIYDGEEPVEIYSAAITVTPGNGGDYNITADLLGYNNKLYKVSMYIGAQGIEDVDAAVKAIKSLINGNVVIEKNGVKYNVNGAVIR